jgi:hypothetical protein
MGRLPETGRGWQAELSNHPCEAPFGMGLWAQRLVCCPRGCRETSWPTAANFLVIRCEGSDLLAREDAGGHLARVPRRLHAAQDSTRRSPSWRFPETELVRFKTTRLRHPRPILRHRRPHACHHSPGGRELAGRHTPRARGAPQPGVPFATRGPFGGKLSWCSRGKSPDRAQRP